MKPASPDSLATPCLLLERDKLQANIERMSQCAQTLGVRLRPHLKTAKSVDIAHLADCSQITVSTLQEAAYFAAAGFRDILYAVSIAPARLPQVLALNGEGAKIQVLLDMMESAHQVAVAAAQRKQVLEAWIEIDVDGHRAGLETDDPALVEIGRFLQHNESTRLAGVMTHAGEAYECRSPAQLVRHAEQERALCVRAAEHLRSAGVDCTEVSVGSTPTALTARSLEGVTELRAGVYMFFDLYQAGLGVCKIEDIALSVLTTVISHKYSHRRLIVDAGGLALSRDRGTAEQARDCGYGLVAAQSGALFPGLQVNAANQEHGMIELPEPYEFCDFPVGSRLRILPNHACMTAAAYQAYNIIGADGSITGQWPRINHW